jgi:hypothetical protein
MSASDIHDTSRETEIGVERSVLAWHGFGSPVGWAILILCSGAAALMWRLALFGCVNS